MLGCLLPTTQLFAQKPSNNNYTTIPFGFFADGIGFTQFNASASLLKGMGAIYDPESKGKQTRYRFAYVSSASVSVSVTRSDNGPQADGGIDPTTVQLLLCPLNDSQRAQLSTIGANPVVTTWPSGASAFGGHGAYDLFLEQPHRKTARLSMASSGKPYAYSRIHMRNAKYMPLGNEQYSVYWNDFAAETNPTGYNPYLWIGVFAPSPTQGALMYLQLTIKIKLYITCFMPRLYGGYICRSEVSTVGATGINSDDAPVLSDPKCGVSLTDMGPLGMEGSDCCGATGSFNYFGATAAPC